MLLSHGVGNHSHSTSASLHGKLERGATSVLQLQCPALAHVDRLVVVNHGSAAWACAGLQLQCSSGWVSCIDPTRQLLCVATVCIAPGTRLSLRAASESPRAPLPRCTQVAGRMPRPPLLCWSWCTRPMSGGPARPLGCSCRCRGRRQGGAPCPSGPSPRTFSGAGATRSPCRCVRLTGVEG